MLLNLNLDFVLPAATPSNAEGRFPGQSKINALQIDGAAVVRHADRQSRSSRASVEDGASLETDRMSLIVDLSY